MTGNKISTLCTLIAAFIFTGTTTLAADATIKVTPISDQIYVLTGKGGNIGLFIGPDGTFLIDDQFAPVTGEILKAIKSVNGEHPKFLINTHYHGDHTGGNENLGKGGTLIFSHHNVRERLSAGAFIEAFNKTIPATAKEGLPIVTFSENISFHLNGDTVEAVHVPHAHTDGDSFIYFRSANVIHAGDIFFNGFYPFIDVKHGGSIKGMIKAVDAILTRADDKTKIIAGHGPLGNKAELETYRQMLVTAHDRLRKLKESGKSATEAVAAKPLADLDKTWGDGFFKSDRWIEIVYPGAY